MFDDVMARREKILQMLADKGSMSRVEIGQALMGEVSETTLLRDLEDLEEEGRIKQLGKARATVYVNEEVERSGLGRVLKSPVTKMTASTSVIADEEPLVEVKVTNPLAYLKRWWQKVIGNEGVKLKFSLEVKPLTAITLTVIVLMVGLGAVTVSALVKYLPFYSRFVQFVTAPDNSRETAMEGRLYREPEGERYFLFTANRNEAVWVQGSKSVDLKSYDDAKVILTGKYNDQTNILAAMSVRLLDEVKQPTESELAPKAEPVSEPEINLEKGEYVPSVPSSEVRLPEGYVLDSYEIEEVSEVACVTNDDCKTPMGYLVQSRCPFTSLCLENVCTVVCPKAEVWEIE